ncbi:MAG: hypothetical protein WKG00_33270 [Polyangiaceae bacterium]
MNDYTRREEARWTFIGSTLLVLCVSAAALLLFTARGKLVPDPAAIATARTSAAAARDAQQCAGWARELTAEVPVFRSTAKAARLDLPTPDPSQGRNRRTPEGPDAVLAWNAALPLLMRSKQLATCRGLVQGAVGVRPSATAGWDAIAAAATLAAPREGDMEGRLGAARRMQSFADAPIDQVAAMAAEAETKLREVAGQQASRAEQARIHEPLPTGLMARESAVAIGVGLAIAALLVSFLSVRTASLRRQATLVPLRELAHTPQRGLHAAAILKLAAQANGGEPGLVIGAAVGGLLAALAFRLDSDMFVAGIMGGLLLGLAAQWLFRSLIGLTRWRARAAELGEVEKPTIPIVLVLSGVNAGLEAQFLDFFDGLGPGDAAATVDRLAAQAEERILAAAEAGIPPSPSLAAQPPPAWP